MPEPRYTGPERRQNPPPEPETPQPLWMKAAIQFGVPAVIAGYLVWIMAGNVSAEVRHIADGLKDHIAVTETNSAAIRRSLDRNEVNQDIIIQLLKLNCLQTSKTLDDRRACYEASRK